MTCLSVIVAFYLLTTLAGIDHALNASVSASNQHRLMTRHKVSLTQSLPINYKQKIAAIKGVEAVSYASWFGGFFKNEKNQLAVIVVDHVHYFDLFTEYKIKKEHLDNWKQNRTGIIVGQASADKYGWEVGDSIPLSTSIWMNRDGLFNWQFTVEAIYQTVSASTDDKRIFFQHEYFDRARAYSQNTVSWYSIKIEANVNADEIIKRIDAQFANASLATLTTTEQLFIREQAQQFVDMVLVIKVVLIAVFFTLLLIVCNTMVQIVRERFNEMAIMKALGFSSLSLVRQIYIEALFLIGLGAIIGSGLAVMTLLQVQKKMADFLPGIAIAPSHYFVIIILVVLTASICRFFPSFSIKRLAISQTIARRK